MKSIRKNKKKRLSIFSYFTLVCGYFFGIFKKKNNEYLESSIQVINSNKRRSLRKPIVFPVENPDTRIRNELSSYGNNTLKRNNWKLAKKEYLKTLSKKKQEDYAYQLRKYHKWQFIYPFYWLWIKFIRIFNLDFIIHKDSRYEFSNDQLEVYNKRQKRFIDWWKHVPIIIWFGIYYHWIKDKINATKYQKVNWFLFALFTSIYITVLSIVISYAVLAKGNKIDAPPFAEINTYPNFFIQKLPLINATIIVAVIGLVLMFVPIIILISLWLSNINDVTYNTIFVFTQQLTYIIVGIFMIASVSMELTIFYAH